MGLSTKPSKLLQHISGKNPQTTVVVIDEVETDNWGISGETFTARKARSITSFRLIVYNDRTSRWRVM